MFDGELFDEFVLLYRLLHVSRFEVPDGAAPSACWLEKWRTEAIEAGARALDQLRDGVADAIAAPRHRLPPASGERPAPRGPGRGPVQARAAAPGVPAAVLVRRRGPRRAAAPGRGPDRPDPVPEVLLRARGCAPPRCAASAPRTATSGRRSGSSSTPSATRTACRELGLPGLGGIYDDTGTDQILRGLELSNEHLLAAVKSLARVYDKSARRWRRVDYRNLGAEELGSIYESLLELVPKWSKEKREFLLDVMPGNERKSTGSYYTPTSLIDCLLDSTLDPVLDDAQKRAEVAGDQRGHRPVAAIADALLAVTVCDPACGSGHFLVAAARRIAKRLAAVREHNPEPTVECAAHRAAGRGEALHLRRRPQPDGGRAGQGLPLAGGPGARQAARLPRRPHQVRQRADRRDPGADRRGHPRQGVQAGRGRRPASGLRRSRSGQRQRPRRPGRALQRPRSSSRSPTRTSPRELAPIADAPDGSLRDVHRQAAAYRDWEHPPRTSTPTRSPTPGAPRSSGTRPRTRPPPSSTGSSGHCASRASPRSRPPPPRRSTRLKSEYGFFHWHLEFPDIFRVPDGADPAVDPATGWSGGFTCLLGNPPWDKVDFEDKKYFSVVEPSIAALAGQRRRARITEWAAREPGARPPATAPRGAR